MDPLCTNELNHVCRLLLLWKNTPAEKIASNKICQPCVNNLNYQSGF